MNKAHNLLLTFNLLSTTECPYLCFYIIFHGRVDLIQFLLVVISCCCYSKNNIFIQLHYLMKELDILQSLQKKCRNIQWLGTVILLVFIPHIQISPTLTYQISFHFQYFCKQCAHYRLQSSGK